VIPYVGAQDKRLSERRGVAAIGRAGEARGRSQAEIIRTAILTYVPGAATDREFALAAGFARIDSDPRPISEIPENELLHGFGE